MHFVIRVIATFGVLLAVAACSTTETVKSASGSGYSVIGQSRGSNVYVCPPPECGSSPIVVVHRSKTLSPSDKAELARATGPDGARYSQLQLQSLSTLSTSTAVFGRGKVRTIAGYKATVLPVSDRQKADRKGSLIILANGDKLEAFVAITETSANAERAAIRFATLWAKEQS